MTKYEVVKLIYGKIDPVGETNTDNERYENLEETIDLVNALLEDIQYVVRYKDNYQYSCKRAGEKAVKFFENIEIEYINQS